MAFDIIERWKGYG